MHKVKNKTILNIRNMSMLKHSGQWSLLVFAPNTDNENQESATAYKRNLELCQQSVMFIQLKRSHLG